MDNELIKLVDETELEYLWRIGQLVEQGKYKWKEIVNILNEQLREEESDYRDESAYRKPFQYAKKYYEEVFSKFKDDTYIKELQLQKREVEKEKVKARTEKSEYLKWLRLDSRDELIMENIINAIRELEPFEIPELIPVYDVTQEGLLVFGDEHYGAEFEIRGLMNEIINAYSPEIFEARMWDLFNKVVSIIQKEDLTVLHVYNMGDFSDGILRVSQLMKLRYGVIEGTVKYADFICNWLDELSKYVHIKFQMVHGNHTELRMLGQPKGTFKKENMGMIVTNMIQTRLANNPNFEYLENPTGLIFDNILGYNFLGIHGEVKSMETALKNFSKIYHVDINYLIAGHLHHGKTETVGIDTDVINVPSIIGADDYSLSLQKTANAGASFYVIKEGEGKAIEYSIKLK